MLHAALFMFSIQFWKSVKLVPPQKKWTQFWRIFANIMIKWVNLFVHFLLMVNFLKSLIYFCIIPSYEWLESLIIQIKCYFFFFFSKGAMVIDVIDMTKDLAKRMKTKLPWSNFFIVKAEDKSIMANCPASTTVSLSMSLKIQDSDFYW